MTKETTKRHKAAYQAQRYIARNLRLLRTMRGLSQEKVATELHMSRSYYSSLEGGKKIPDFMTLCTLADFYEVRLDYLLGFDIAGHFMSLLSDSNYTTETAHFAERYMKLSYGAKRQVFDRIAALLHEEENYNHYPWDYDYED